MNSPYVLMSSLIRTHTDRGMVMQLTSARWESVPQIPQHVTVYLDGQNLCCIVYSLS